MSQQWDAIGFVISSKYRIAVVRRLASTPATPTEIANDEGLSTAHVSRALQRLLGRSIVELIVPESQRKNRIYALTERGKTLWNQIRESGLDT